MSQLHMNVYHAVFLVFSSKVLAGQGQGGAYLEFQKTKIIYVIYGG
jgi:hypothetical protein